MSISGSKQTSTLPAEGYSPSSSWWKCHAPPRTCCISTRGWTGSQEAARCQSGMQGDEPAMPTSFTDSHPDWGGPLFETFTRVVLGPMPISFTRPMQCALHVASTLANFWSRDWTVTAPLWLRVLLCYAHVCMSITQNSPALWRQA